jgi:hypothetical protein
MHMPMDLRSLVPVPRRDVEAAQGIIATLIFIAFFTVAIGIAALDISRLVASAFSVSAG